MLNPRESGILELLQPHYCPDRAFTSCAGFEIFRVNLLLRLRISQLAPQDIVSATIGAVDRESREMVEKLDSSRALALPNPEDRKEAGIEAIVISPRLGDFNEDLRLLGFDALRAASRVQIAAQDVARFMELAA